MKRSGMKMKRLCETLTTCSEGQRSNALGPSSHPPPVGGCSKLLKPKVLSSHFGGGWRERAISLPFEPKKRWSVVAWL